MRERNATSTTPSGTIKGRLRFRGDVLTSQGAGRRADVSAVGATRDARLSVVVWFPSERGGLERGERRTVLYVFGSGPLGLTRIGTEFPLAVQRCRPSPSLKSHPSLSSRPQRRVREEP